MRKALVPAVLAVIFAMLSASPASALPGPEPGSADFSITFTLDPTPRPGPGVPFDSELVEQLNFDTALGWDFGNREGYQCAWIEFFDRATGEYILKWEFERLKVPGRDDAYVEINDRFGVETEGGAGGPKPQRGTPDGCGMASGMGNARPHDGTDHFPHHTHNHFTRADVEVPNTFFDLQPHEPPDCDGAYWTPADEPGESILWWDPDGPQNDGHGDLPCSGGPEPPEAIVRAMVTYVAPGVVVCTHDELAGSWCSDAAPPPTPDPEPEPSPESPPPDPAPCHKRCVPKA